MHSALAQFEGNIKRARDLASLAKNLGAHTTGALDVTDLLRASLIAAVSALDHFIHELTRKGMLEVATGVRPPTEAYLRFSISMSSVTTLLAHPGQLQVLDDEIRERHGWLSFQDPKKIADALRLVSGKELWSEVGNLLGITGTDAKAKLKLVVNRRNQIAHEADMDPTLPGIRWPIDSAIVEDAIEIVEKSASGIFSILTVP